ncbi:MAG: beta-ketoacyl-[acyl-carrier-protein] synthase family protein [Phycisphaerales bacterium]|nr:MAG: beta-ketoacyl-[acyl-carrier-protein] synthase family protein [Phycisphaerales bacterium]
MERRTVITGMGWITPLGHDIDAVWKRLLAGESGVAATTLFDAATYPTTFSAQVKDFDPQRFIGAEAWKRHADANRNTQFALAAAELAWRDAGLAGIAAVDPTRVGIYLGGGEGAIDFDNFVDAALAGCRDDAGITIPLDAARWARRAMAILNAIREQEQEPNLPASHLAVRFDARGPNFNTLTACAASTQAIGEATQMIRRGDADVIISGGTHSMIHPLGVTGFNRLTALSTRNECPAKASRPFDRNRDGFVLGEGSGIIILESLDHARNRGADIKAEIIGYGSTADAFRITDIHDRGRGAIAAMRLAMENAGVGIDEIDYISAHGTGTAENDTIETLAIRSLFGDRAPRVPVSSIKSMMGHLIAAAGVVEVITCVLAIRDGVLPPTINYETPDPNCNLDYVPNHARKADVNVVLSNSFGFGGQNDTLVVRRFER